MPWAEHWQLWIPNSEDKGKHTIVQKIHQLSSQCHNIHFLPCSGLRLQFSLYPIDISEKSLHFCNFFFLSCIFLLQSRVHCFHYLIPLTKQGNYAIVANVESMDYDPLVVKLNKDISAIEEVMGAALQQHKFQYIFEGQCGAPVFYSVLLSERLISPSSFPSH